MTASEFLRAAPTAAVAATAFGARSPGLGPTGAARGRRASVDSLPGSVGAASVAAAVTQAHLRGYPSGPPGHDAGSTYGGYSTTGAGGAAGGGGYRAGGSVGTGSVVGGADAPGSAGKAPARIRSASRAIVGLLEQVEGHMHAIGRSGAAAGDAASSYASGGPTAYGGTAANGGPSHHGGAAGFGPHGAAGMDHLHALASGDSARSEGQYDGHSATGLHRGRARGAPEAPEAAIETGSSLRLVDARRGRRNSRDGSIDGGLYPAGRGGGERLHDTSFISGGDSASVDATAAAISDLAAQMAEAGRAHRAATFSSSLPQGQSEGQDRRQDREQAQGRGHSQAPQQQELHARSDTADSGHLQQQQQAYRSLGGSGQLPGGGAVRAVSPMVPQRSHRPGASVSSVGGFDAPPAGSGAQRAPESPQPSPLLSGAGAAPVAPHFRFPAASPPTAAPPAAGASAGPVGDHRTTSSAAPGALLSPGGSLLSATAPSGGATSASGRGGADRLSAVVLARVLQDVAAAREAVAEVTTVVAAAAAGQARQRLRHLHQPQAHGKGPGHPPHQQQLQYQQRSVSPASGRFSQAVAVAGLPQPYDTGAVGGAFGSDAAATAGGSSDASFESSAAALDAASLKLATTVLPRLAGLASGVQALADQHAAERGAGTQAIAQLQAAVAGAQADAAAAAHARWRQREGQWEALTGALRQRCMRAEAALGKAGLPLAEPLQLPLAPPPVELEAPDTGGSGGGDAATGIREASQGGAGGRPSAGRGRSGSEASDPLHRQAGGAMQDQLALAADRAGDAEAEAARLRAALAVAHAQAAAGADAALREGSTAERWRADAVAAQALAGDLQADLQRTKAGLRQSLQALSVALRELPGGSTAKDASGSGGAAAAGEGSDGLRAAGSPHAGATIRRSAASPSPARNLSSYLDALSPRSGAAAAAGGGAGFGTLAGGGATHAASTGQLQTSHGGGEADAAAAGDGEGGDAALPLHARLQEAVQQLIHLSAARLGRQARLLTSAEAEVASLRRMAQAVSPSRAAGFHADSGVGTAGAVGSGGSGGSGGGRPPITRELVLQALQGVSDEALGAAGLVRRAAAPKHAHASPELTAGSSSSGAGGLASPAAVAAAVARARAEERDAVIREMAAAAATAGAAGGASVDAAAAAARAAALAATAAATDRENVRLRGELKKLQAAWAGTAEKYDRDAAARRAEAEGLQASLRAAQDALAGARATSANSSGDVAALRGQLASAALAASQAQQAAAGDAAALRAELERLRGQASDIQTALEEAAADAQRAEAHHHAALREAVDAAEARATQRARAAADAEHAAITRQAVADAEQRATAAEAAAGARREAALAERLAREAAAERATAQAAWESDTRRRLAAAAEVAAAARAEAVAAAIDATQCEERAEAAARLAAQADGYEAQAAQLRDRVAACRDVARSERVLRRTLHAKLLDLQGNIRVHVRVRPPREALAAQAAAAAAGGAGRRQRGAAGAPGWGSAEDAGDADGDGGEARYEDQGFAEGDDEASGAFAAGAAVGLQGEEDGIDGDYAHAEGGGVVSGFGDDADAGSRRPQPISEDGLASPLDTRPPLLPAALGSYAGGGASALGTPLTGAAAGGLLARASGGRASGAAAGARRGSAGAMYDATSGGGSGSGPAAVEALGDGQLLVYTATGLGSGASQALLPPSSSFASSAGPSPSSGPHRSATARAAGGSLAASGSGGFGNHRRTLFESEFDHVHGPDARQRDVWEHVRPMVDAALRGYNGAVLAYGQVGGPLRAGRRGYGSGYSCAGRGRRRQAGRRCRLQDVYSRGAAAPASC